MPAPETAPVGDRRVGSAALVVGIVAAVFVLPVAVVLIGWSASGPSGDIPPGALLLVYTLIASSIAGPVAALLGLVAIVLAVIALAKRGRSAKPVVALILGAISFVLPLILRGQFFSR